MNMVNINQHSEIVNKYLNGDSLKGLGLEYVCDKKTIKRILIKNNVKIEPRENGKRKHVLNANYFEFIDSPKKAYYLGFMFADGYALADGYASGITLAITDREILEGLSIEVYGSAEPVYDIKKMQTNKIPQSRIIFKSKIFHKNLVNKNLTPNKSLTLIPPLGVPKKLIKYFVHGYFDGDGCFSKPHWSIVSTLLFCKWVADFLLENGLLSKYYINPTKNGKTYRLSAHRDKDILNLFNFFYVKNPSPVFLKRKKDKMFDYLTGKPCPLL